MRLVIITKRYDSSVINQKVQPTPLDAEGNPMYAIYLSDERAQTLIDAGVAEEYVTEDLIVDDSNDGVVTDPDTNEGATNTDSNPEDSDADDNVDGDANNEDPNADDSSNDESEEQTTDTKSKSNSKKNKSSK